MSIIKFLTIKRIGLILGPFLFFLVYGGLIPVQGLSDSAAAVLACTLWITTWWITEAIPISAASLLPMVILPMTGGASIGQTTAAYGDKMLFLFVGGFMIAIAMQKWNLHKRIALNIIVAVGGKAHTLILGFMLATGFLSMWISNTATTLMMVTIAIALISQMQQYLSENGTTFYKALLLSIAFSSSIGGVATLIGTPTNPILVAIFHELYGVEISFLDWMIFALPFSILMLACTWFVLTKVVFNMHAVEIPVGQELIKTELKQMGKMTLEEKSIAWVFAGVAVAWITHSFLLDQIIPGINDTSIAIIGALILFILPSSEQGKHILTWDEAERLPWGIIILFGGGLSIAAAFQSSGLDKWLGMLLSNAENLPLFALILVVTLAVNFLTEVTSNVAIASIVLPILASLAAAIGLEPSLLMVPATMAASCAFMLPVATAPNAIVFGSGHLKIGDMVRAGIWLNLISTLIITALAYWLVPLVL